MSFNQLHFDMLTRTVAALETPGDLTDEERRHLIADAGALLARREQAGELPELPAPWQCETRMCPPLFTGDQLRAYAETARAMAGPPAEVVLHVEDGSIKGAWSRQPVRIAVYDHDMLDEDEAARLTRACDTARTGMVPVTPETITPIVEEVVREDRFTAQFGPYSAGDPYDLDDLPVPQALAPPPAA